MSGVMPRKIGQGNLSPHGFGLTDVASNGNAVFVKNSLIPFLHPALLYVWLH